METIKDEPSPRSTTEASDDNNNEAINNNGHSLMEEKTVNGETAKEGSNLLDEPSEENGLNTSNSNFSGSERSPNANCGVFDYRHNDTDSDEDKISFKSAEEKEEYKKTPPNYRRHIRRVKRNFSYRRTVPQTPDFIVDEDAQQEALQKIIDSAILPPIALNSNLPSSDAESMTSLQEVQMNCCDQEENGNNNCNKEEMESKVVVTNGKSKEGCISEVCVKEKKVESRVEVKKVEGHVEVKKLGGSIGSSSQESLHRLINGVDSLVHQHSVLSPRQCLKPLYFNNKEESKQKRIRRWLSSQTETPAVVDSCDASGELTTGDSDADSESSFRQAECSSSAKGGVKSLDATHESSENTPIVEVFPSMQVADTNSSNVKVIKYMLAFSLEMLHPGQN